MKKYIGYPLLAVFGGAAAFGLRLMQNSTGFERSTGLPVAGNFYAGALPILLGIFAALFFAMSRRLPAEKADASLPFSSCFRTTGAGIPTILVLGAFAWIAAGGISIYNGLIRSGTGLIAGASTIYTTAAGTCVLTPMMSVLTGCLYIFAGGCLLPVISLCRFRTRRTAHPAKAGGIGTILLSTACLVILLIITYREDSVNPSLSVYYVELLAQAGLILLLYRTSSFAYHEGRTRRFTFYSMLTVMLCLATLADGHSLSCSIFYAGGILLSLGFLMLRLNTLARAETRPSSNGI